MKKALVGLLLMFVLSAAIADTKKIQLSPEECVAQAWEVASLMTQEKRGFPLPPPENVHYTENSTTVAQWIFARNPGLADKFDPAAVFEFLANECLESKGRVELGEEI